MDRKRLLVYRLVVQELISVGPLKSQTLDAVGVERIQIYQAVAPGLLSSIPSVGLSVCLSVGRSVWVVYCGNTAD